MRSPWDCLLVTHYLRGDEGQEGEGDEEEVEEGKEQAALISSSCLSL
jgi:hypothetical protein